jgi:FkbM family methyltransferase
MDSSEVENVQNYLRNLSKDACIPDAHTNYLKKLKESGYEPKVIYDIGACILQWSKVAHELWPEAEIFLFDAFNHSEFLFKESGYKYHIGVLSDRDDREVKFYQNDQYPGGNSYYKECNDNVFPPDKYKTYKTRSLDSIVAEKGYPKPDLIKIDVQGSEHDVLAGAIETFKDCRDMIVEMQHEQYNLGAPLVKETQPYIESLGWKCVAPLFCNNGPDGDYHFVRSN